jgi:hypothetical protein
MVLGLCFGVAAWSLFFLGHLVAMRRAAPARRAYLDQILFLLGLLSVPAGLAAAMLVLGESAWTHGGVIPGSLWGMLAYVALFTLYMPFFYTVATSLSVRTIVLLARSPDGALPIQALFDRFGSRALVEGRLLVMMQNGLLLQRGGEYHLTSKGYVVAQAFSRIKQFWRLGAGG